MQAASAMICLTSYLYRKAEILTTPAVLSHVTDENVNTGSYSKREVQEQLSQMCCINRFYYNFLGTEGALPSILGLGTCTILWPKNSRIPIIAPNNFNLSHNLSLILFLPISVNGIIRPINERNV